MEEFVLPFSGLGYQQPDQSVEANQHIGNHYFGQEYHLGNGLIRGDCDYDETGEQEHDTQEVKEDELGKVYLMRRHVNPHYVLRLLCPFYYHFLVLQLVLRLNIPIPKVRNHVYQSLLSVEVLAQILGSVDVL